MLQLVFYRVSVVVFSDLDGGGGVLCPPSFQQESPT